MFGHADLCTMVGFLAEIRGFLGFLTRRPSGGLEKSVKLPEPTGNAVMAGLKQRFAPYQRADLATSQIRAVNVRSWLGADPAGRASQCPEWDDEQTFGVALSGCRSPIRKPLVFRIPQNA